MAEHTSKEHLKSKSGIIVEGLDDLAVRFSKCCGRFREMKLLDLLQEAAVCQFTVPIV